MPSQLPLPTVAELVSAGSDALTGERDRFADTRTGSMYNHTIGPVAILLAREADRDKDLFKDIYFDSASGQALTDYVQKRTGIMRVLDTFGQGTCTFTRASTSGGGGVFYPGTRIQVPGGSSSSIYQVSTVTNVSSSATVINVPISATVVGKGTAVSASNSLSLLDPVYDNSWTPQQIVCADGTNFESAAAYKSRVIQAKLAERTGYFSNMITACQSVGARYVIGFTSDFGLDADDFDDDFGLNAIYVADSAYQSPASLIAACSSTLEGWRVLGADLLVGGVTNVPLSINVLASLSDVPSKLPTQSIRRLCAQAALAAFSTTSGGYTYSIKSIMGAVVNASPYVQTASVPTVWNPSTNYSLGDLVVYGSSVQQASESGESGLVQPAFSIVPGSSVFDGSMSWTCSSFPSTGIFAGDALQTSDPSISPNSWPAKLTRYTLGVTNITFSFIGPL